MLCRDLVDSFEEVQLILEAKTGSFYSGLAQLVEHLTVNQVVVSSSLTTGVFYGELSERLKEHGWKPCIRVLPVSRVRIPYSPLSYIRM